MEGFLNINQIKIKTSYSDSTIRRFLKDLTNEERKIYTRKQGNKILIDSAFFIDRTTRSRYKAGKDLDLDLQNSTGLSNRDLINKLLKDQDERIAYLNKSIEMLNRALNEKEIILNEKDKRIDLLINKILSTENEIKQLTAKQAQTGSNQEPDKTFYLAIFAALILIAILLIYLLK
jgi:uncharacterized coiled-coil protein SlyX